MASLLQFARRKAEDEAPVSAAVSDFLRDFSIEVMPRTAAKIEDFTAILPQGTRVYIALIEGTPIEDMLATAKRLAEEGFPVMPHFPARIIADKTVLEDWVKRYADLGINQALLLAGGVSTPAGEYHSSMQLLESGVFDAHGFTRLHVAGHPEGNRDIDPTGGDKSVMEALHWKNAFAERTDAAMAIATQFAFEPQPVIDWANRLKAEGVNLPIHIGIAGPAKLQTMIKFAMACGVGPSLRVLQRRAKDLTKLVLPFTPDEMLEGLAEHKAQNPDFNITNVHFFPLGGIAKTAEYTAPYSQAAARTAS